MRPGAHPKYRPDIDGLRAVAVLAVIGFHVSPLKVQGGFVGVDVFFVVSGYLISGIILNGLERGTFSFAEFYARRIRRIFPALIIVLVACLTIAWFALLASEYQLLGKHVAASAVFVLNFVLLGEVGYFDSAAELKPLLHLWSLSIEEQFYVIWPLLLFLVWRRRKHVFTLIAGLTAASFVVNVALIGTNPSASFYLPFSRFWELGLGCLLAYVDLRWRADLSPVLERSIVGNGRRSLRIEDLMAILGAALVTGTIVGIDKHRAFPGWWALLPAIGTCLLIWAGPGARISRRLLSQPMMVYIGLISYPLYLWHWPLISFARIVDSGEPSRAIKLAIVAASLVLASLTYELVEKPIRFGGRRRPATVIPWRGPAILAMAMLTAGAAALTVYARSGFPARVEDEVASQQQLELVRTPRVDSRCEQYVQEANRLFEYCRFDRSEASDIVAIIGDSHAHSWFAGLAERFAADGAGTLLLASSGCPPLMGTATGIQPEDKALCSRKTGQILDVVLARPEIVAVIIITRGPLWITGKGFGAVEESIDLGVISPTGADAPRSPSGLATFEAGLKRTAEALTRRGKSVSYVLQVPELGVSPASCIRRPLELTLRNSCEVDLKVMNERHAEYRERVRALSRSIAGFNVIDPFPALCDGGRCRAFHGERLLYADDNHLSVSGSRYLAARLF